MRGCGPICISLSLCAQPMDELQHASHHEMIDRITKWKFSDARLDELIEHNDGTCLRAELIRNPRMSGAFMDPTACCMIPCGRAIRPAGSRQQEHHEGKRQAAISKQHTQLGVDIKLEIDLVKLDRDLNN